MANIVKPIVKKVVPVSQPQVGNGARKMNPSAAKVPVAPVAKPQGTFQEIDEFGAFLMNETNAVFVRTVSVNGKPRVDIRNFFTEDGEAWIPSKKGLCLTPEVMEATRGAIDAALASLSA